MGNADVSTLMTPQQCEGPLEILYDHQGRELSEYFKWPALVLVKTVL